MTPTRSTAPPVALPPVLAGRRRGLMARLVALAVAQAATAMVLALLVGALVTRAGSGTGVVPVAALLVVAVAAVAAATYGTRVQAERLGQDYVHELRGLLVRAALGGRSATSLGITIARVTNDLTSVRGWVAQGVPPLVAAGPLLVAGLLVLGLQHPTVAVAAMIPLTVMGTAAAVLMPWAYGRARRLRRARGRLASHLTDTLTAREAVLAAGGADREARRLAGASRRVADAAVERARAAGALQAAAATTAAAIAVLVAATGVAAGLGAGRLATALTVAGVLAAPLTEAGRIAELRQNFRAARRVLAPLVGPLVGTPLGAGTPLAAGGPADRCAPADGRVVVAGLLSAGPGDRVRLTGHGAGAVLRDLASPYGERRVVVDGWDLAAAAPARRRELVGLAATGQAVERGTLTRVVRYRRPDLDPADATAALHDVGLGPVLATLERAERTELRRGGEPLTAADRARLALARAAYGGPPLLLLDRLDADLDPDGREVLRRVVADHPGVVVFTSDAPAGVAPDHRDVTVA